MLQGGGGEIDSSDAMVGGTHGGGSGASAGAQPKRFHVAGVIDPSLHYGIDRSAWHRELATNLMGGTYQLLHAHRQGGKSTAALAVARLAEKDGWLALAVTLENLTVDSREAAWKSLASSMRAVVQALARRSELAPRPRAVAAAFASTPLFADADTFKEYFLSSAWNGQPVLLIIDEFDKLLQASADVRSNILEALRALKTSNVITPSVSPSAGGQPYALCAVLGIGVYRVLQLGARDPTEHASPFNVAEATVPPLPSDDDARAMFAQYDAEHGITTPPEVIADIITRSGKHVGLLSFLGKALSKKTAVDLASWCACMSGSGLQGELLESATINSMLKVFDTGYGSGEIQLHAKAMVRHLLTAPDGLAFEVSDSDTDKAPQDALDLLLSEGTIVRSDEVGADNRLYRITAPLLNALLHARVGSWADMSRMPSGFVLSRYEDGKLHLVKTVLECLPYFSITQLFHKYALLKDDETPCEFAFHAQLYAILHRRAAVGGWHVLFESRNSQILPLRRLHIYIASNGHKCGIELLVNGVDFDKHVKEQAPVYKRDQNLESMLVLNFITKEIDSRTLPAACEVDAGIYVMNVFVNHANRTMTPYVLQDGVYVPQSAVSSGVGDVTALEAGMRSFTLHGTGGAVTTHVTIDGNEYPLVETMTVADLLSYFDRDRISPFTDASTTSLHRTSDSPPTSRSMRAVQTFTANPHASFVVRRGDLSWPVVR